MGCRGSTAVLERQEIVDPGRLPEKGSELPIAEKVAAASEGSDTSTDDISSASQQDLARSSSMTSLESSENPESNEKSEALDHPDKEVESALEWRVTLPETAPEALNAGHECEAPFLEIGGIEDLNRHGCKGDVPLVKDTALQILHHHLGSQFNITPSESEASTPRSTPRVPAAEDAEATARRQSAGKQVAPSRRVSCLRGTSQRELGRRVSFTEGGPEVVHVEVDPLEKSLSTLRRANAISADDMDDMEPLSPEPLEPLTWNDPELETPPWADHLDSMAVYEPQFSPQATPQCVSRFGLCCVPHFDGNGLQGDLQYDVCEEGEDTFNPPCSPFASRTPQTQAGTSLACL